MPVKHCPLSFFKNSWDMSKGITIFAFTTKMIIKDGKIE